MGETERLGFKLLPRDKDALRRLTSAEGETMSVVVRRLIREEARRCGLWPVQDGREARAEQVSGRQPT